MVYAGRQASQARIDRLKRILSQIKSEFPGKEICVSTGFVTNQGAVELKQAGLDRLNHNLNTSESHYPNICTTHTYTDRLNTLLAAKSAGLKVCSGMIVGMGEEHKDIIDVTLFIGLGFVTKSRSHGGNTESPVTTFFGARFV